MTSISFRERVMNIYLLRKRRSGCALLERVSAIGLFAGLSVATTPVSAQTAPANVEVAEDATAPESDQNEPIIVTALRRETNLQTTPAAISALSEKDLLARGISDVQSLSQALPGISFGQRVGQAQIAIRGIGADNVTAGQDPRVAFYQDGVYIARPSAQLGGAFDIERVEVLRGPQGTLYGRNATAGAVNFISRRPTFEPSGYIRIGYGNYDDVTLDSAAGGPLSPNLAARLAVHYRRHDGHGTNRTNGDDIDDKDEFGVRASLLWEPLSNLSLLTSFDRFRESDNGFGLHTLGQGNPLVPLTGLALGGTTVLRSRDIASDTTPSARVRAWGIRETAELKLDWATITSITSYRKTKTLFVTDIDGTSLPLSVINITEDSKQFSEELQISGNTGNLDWLVGALYFTEDNTPGNTIPVNSLVVGGPNSLRQGFFTGGKLKTTAYSIYSRLSLELAEGLTASVGGRYNSEKKKINDIFQLDFSRPFDPSNPLIPIPPFPRSDDVTFKDFLPSGALEWKLNSDIFAYASYTEGFKSGGFNLGVDQPPFRPEKIRSYELGIRTTWLNKRLTANVTAFHYNYKDLQVQQVRGQTTQIENAASAKIKGLEIETRLGPIEGITLAGSLTYLDAKYRKFFSIDPVFVADGPQNLSGNRLTQAPKFSYSLSAEKRFDIGVSALTFRGEYNHVSGIFYTPFNSSTLAQDGYGIGNASVRYEGPGTWSVEAYVRNIGNKFAIAQTFVGSNLLGFPAVGVLIPPRTYGIRLGYNF